MANFWMLIRKDVAIAGLEERLSCLPEDES